jgi:hypothetical protein
MSYIIVASYVDRKLNLFWGRGWGIHTIVGLLFLTNLPKWAQLGTFICVIEKIHSHFCNHSKTKLVPGENRVLQSKLTFLFVCVGHAEIKKKR